MWEKIVAFFTADGFTYELLLAFIPLIPILRPRKYGALRIVGCVIAEILLACLTFGYCVGESGVLSSMWYVGVAVVTIGAVMFCFKGDFWNALFLGMSAYVIQHIFFRISKLWEYILHVCGVKSGSWLYALTYIVSMAAVYAYCYFYYIARLRKEKNFKANNTKLLLTTALIVVALIVLNHFAVRELEVLSLEYSSISLLYIFFGLVCGVVLLDSLYTNVYNKKLEEDFRIIQLLWQNDRKQYEMFRQNLETMNIKSHDLKHQLGLLSQHEQTEGGRQWIAEAIDSLNVLGMMQKTGNETLDVVLVQQHMKCDAAGIEFITIVDGSLLAKMEDVDIYSLFGNALDNAVEYLGAIEDVEKRTLSLTVRRVGEMVKIQVENYTSKQVPIVGGLPQTTKQDKLSHGYGVKSIAFIVEKYGGIMNFEASENSFILDIMIPL